MLSWEELDDRHKGKTGLIIGNGPSLRFMPLEFLRKYPSLGSNRIYLLDGFTPTYYACINPLVCDQYLDDIRRMPVQAMFLRSPFHDEVEGSLALYSMFEPDFSLKPYLWIYEGFTVTYVLLQIAYFMGFETVLMVGVDHNYQFEGSPNEEKVATGEDPNHFHPGYFSGGMKWHNPDLANSEISYGMAKEAFDMVGRRVINLTPGSRLDIFDKEDWQKWA